LSKARFTADSNPVTNIDAGKTDENLFFLATGGDIENKTVPLWQTIELPASDRKPPTGLPTEAAK
jgi:hypothetical protein